MHYNRVLSLLYMQLYSITLKGSEGIASYCSLPVHIFAGGGDWGGGGLELGKWGGEGEGGSWIEFQNTIEIG